MAQTKEGAMLLAARHHGISLAVYKQKSKTRKHCVGCKTWRRRDDFWKDRTRCDGLDARCKRCRNEFGRSRYKPKPRPKPGRRYVEARDGDKKQARSRVNYLVRVGILDDPDDVACVDCGHLGEGLRHEFDHFLGYAAEHHEDVEVLCSVCHSKRTHVRGEDRWSRRAERDALGRFVGG